MQSKQEICFKLLMRDYYDTVAYELIEEAVDDILGGVNFTTKSVDEIDAKIRAEYI